MVLLGVLVDVLRSLVVLWLLRRCLVVGDLRTIDGRLNLLGLGQLRLDRLLMGRGLLLLLLMALVGVAEARCWDRRDGHHLLTGLLQMQKLLDLVRCLVVGLIVDGRACVLLDLVLSPLAEF